MNPESSKRPPAISISIGMPVFNGDKTIEAALDCILNQTYCDFELIISDNASTDKTEEICRKYAANDSRILYIRQPENIGAVSNFAFVLSKAHANYFMWAASDDVRSIDFLEVNYSFLKNNPDYTASTSPTRFEGGDFDSKSMGDGTLNGSLPERFQNYFNCWHSNGRFYSLMKLDSVLNSKYLREDFFGSDWATMLSIITHGKTHRHNKGYVVLGRKGFSNSGTIFKHYRKSWIHWFIPFAELSKAVLEMSANFPLKHRAPIIWSLIKLNRRAMRASLRIERKMLLAR
jgi:glycosyltransferase involved in cell wall biosynthesis